MLRYEQSSDWFAMVKFATGGLAWRVTAPSLAWKQIGPYALALYTAAVCVAGVRGAWNRSAEAYRIPFHQYWLSVELR